MIGIDLRSAEVVADLATPDGRHKAVEATAAASGGVLDGLVSAAGLGPTADAGLIARVNYFGSHALLAGLRPSLAASTVSQVVQFGSNSSTTTPGLTAELMTAYLEGREDDAVELVRIVEPLLAPAVAYAAAKLAISRWCRRVATTPDWIGEGVRLNVIAPGPVDTPMLEAVRSDEHLGPLMGAFPVPANETPAADALAAWVEQMLTGEAARYMCGSVVFVDGGTDALLRSDAWPEAL